MTDAARPDGIVPEPPAPRPDVRPAVAPDVRRRPFTLPPFVRSLIGFFVLLIVFLVWLTWTGDVDRLWTPYYWQNVLHSNREVAVLALGMLVVIIAGGIDLSVGSVAALAGVVAMKTYVLVWGATELPALASVAAVLAGLLAGGACGAVNGVSVGAFRVSPFVTTLGMMSIARGVAVWYSDKVKVAFPANSRPPWLVEFQHLDSDTLFFDPGVWSVVALGLLMALLLRYTVFGRYCYAIGSNEATAELCGVPVTRYKIAVYALSGVCAGWAGTLFITNLEAGDPQVGMGLELDAIAAAVLGGASLAGGRGTVAGTALGILLLAMLGSIVGLIQATLELKYLLIGSILITYTAVNQWQRRGAA